MKYLVTRRRIYFAEVEAENEDEALNKADMLLEENWEDDDRPDEYSIECDPVEDDLGLNCDGHCFGCDRTCIDRVGTYCPD